MGAPGFIERLIALGEAPPAQRSAAWDGFNPARARAASSTVVSPRTVRGVPAYGQAVRLAAEAVAGLRMGVWKGDPPERKRVSGSWQARLLRGALNGEQTRFEFWETVEESLGYRANAYIWKLAGSSRVTELWALHPDQVSVLVEPRRVVYRVMLGNGYVDPLGTGGQMVTVDRSTILHIRGHGGGGLAVAPSPVQVYRRALAAALSKEAHEEALYGRRATFPLGISFPEGISPEQVREFKEMWTESYGSVEDTGKVPVIGGGGRFEKIGLTQADAQFVEAMNLSVEEIARITNVQASLLGVTHSNRPLTPEHEEDRWHRYGLGPRLERIESAFEGDPDLFGPGAGTYPMFDLGVGVRGDLTTEETLAHQQVQDGRLLVDEWRAGKGLPPLPGGLGSVPQIVPVGGAPNPVSTVPGGVPDDDADDDQED